MKNTNDLSLFRKRSLGLKLTEEEKEQYKLYLLFHVKRAHNVSRETFTLCIHSPRL